MFSPGGVAAGRRRVSSRLDTRGPRCQDRPRILRPSMATDGYTAMNSALQAWGRACAGSGALRFVDVNLRGIGQVMFQDNPLSGLLFLAAVA